MTFDLPSLGWDGYFAGGYAGYDRRGRRPARVSRVDNGICTVLAADGIARASLAGAVLAAAATDRAALPCPGDWVVLHTWPDRRVTVEAVLPRRTAVRRDGTVLVANLDVVAVVEPLDAPDPDRLRRNLALAARSGAAPLVILSRADLAGPARWPGLVPSGVAAHRVSARTGAGLAHLRRHFAPGRTVGLLGPSGAGKSSLVDALAGAAVVTAPALRADGRRRQPTTVRTLLPLPGGGIVLDSPGLPDAPQATEPPGIRVTGLARRAPVAS